MYVINASKLESDFRDYCKKNDIGVIAGCDIVSISPATFTRFHSKIKGGQDVIMQPKVLDKICNFIEGDKNEYILKDIETFTPGRSGGNAPTRKVLRGGIKITTYTKSDEEPRDTQEESSIPDKAISNIKSHVFSFLQHMEIYRRLLKLSKDDMNLKYPSYSEIEERTASLSFSAYMEISRIFIEAYKHTSDGPFKIAFKSLAYEYNDIYIDVMYFGDGET